MFEMRNTCIYKKSSHISFKTILFFEIELFEISTQFNFYYIKEPSHIPEDRHTFYIMALYFIESFILLFMCNNSGNLSKRSITAVKVEWIYCYLSYNWKNSYKVFSSPCIYISFVTEKCYGFFLTHIF